MVRAVLMQLALRDVRIGGVWDTEPALWRRFDQPWNSGQHVYHHFDQIIERRMFAERHCSWECPHYKGHARLEKGMFPQTDDLLRRALQIDLHPLLTERDEFDIVRGMRKVASALL